MKKFLFFAMLLPILTACVGQNEDIFLPVDKNGDETLGHSINETKALEIANKTLSESGTRSNFDFPTIEYITTDINGEVNTLSSISAPTDTLAYIINYPENSGFAIISKRTNVCPVLAFSEEGNFSMDNEIAKENFVDNLKYYIEESNKDYSTLIVPDLQPATLQVGPYIGFNMDQWDPWNKYVCNAYPDICPPAGCVAVASAYIMIYGKEKLTYHGMSFDMKSIADALTLKNVQISSNSNIENPVAPMMFYNTAVNLVAQLLYYIGPDVNMTYTSDSSSASESAAYNLINSLGYTITSGFTTNNNIDNIITYINNGHIIFMTGDNQIAKGAHAWVIDGRKTVKAEGTIPYPETFIHCNWGWGGKSNGYFNGEVFEADYAHHYKPRNYFAVKLGYEL